MKRTAALIAPLLLILGFAGCKKKAPAPVGKRYTVNVEAKTPSVVRVTPGQGWKMNLEYPNKLTATAKPSGQEIKLGPKDAKVSDRELTFSVPVAKPGAVSGQVSFAICNPKTCIPVRTQVAWKVTGK